MGAETGLFLRRGRLRCRAYFLARAEEGDTVFLDFRLKGSSDHLSETMHERPGVYSSYDASTVVSAGRAAKVIGVAAKAVKGTAGEVVTLTGYAAGVAAFGEDARIRRG